MTVNLIVGLVIAIPSRCWEAVWAYGSVAVIFGGAAILQGVNP